MLRLKSREIEKYDKLGSGAFGSVYRIDDDLAIKLYHPEVKTLFGGRKANPQLKKRNRALRIKRIGKDLKHSDLIQDLVYIDDSYAGVVIPFYDGVTLNHMMNAPLETKIDISKQLIRNCKELTEHHIYPLDFKLNNMMYVNGEVKLIDLDDYYTKYLYFNSEIHKRDCVSGLDETIKTYFGEYRECNYNECLDYYLTRERPEGKNKYKDIDSYIKEKDTPYNYLFIDTDSDIEIIKRLKSQGDFRIILLFNSNEYDGELFVDFFNQLEKNGIYVYDMIRKSEFDLYFSNNKTDSMQYVKGRECFKK